MQRLFVPPNGFVGAAQQTQATQLLNRGSVFTGTRSRRRKSRASSSRTRRKKTRISTRSRGLRKKLKKGSPEAKAFMARLRKMRKR